MKLSITFDISSTDYAKLQEILADTGQTVEEFFSAYIGAIDAGTVVFTPINPSKDMQIAMEQIKSDLNIFRGGI